MHRRLGFLAAQTLRRVAAAEARAAATCAPAAAQAQALQATAAAPPTAGTPLRSLGKGSYLDAQLASVSYGLAGGVVREDEEEEGEDGEAWDADDGVDAGEEDEDGELLAAAGASQRSRLTWPPPGNAPPELLDMVRPRGSHSPALRRLTPPPVRGRGGAPR